MPRKQEETRFKEKIRKILLAIPGLWFVKIQQLVIRGTPDILICYRGRFVAWELKTETGRPSALQEYNIAEINKAGGIARLVSPSTLQEALEELYGSTPEDNRDTSTSTTPDRSPRRGPLR